LRKLSKEGKTILVQVSWTLVRDSDGRPTSMLAINSDLTEKKKLETQFLRAQRMESIGTLAGGIAHDLNNVLAPILMSVEVLKVMVENEEGLSLLETMMSSAQRGADLVKQVLAFARGLEGQRIPVNAGHLVRDLGRVMLDTFPKNLVISVKLSPQIWTVTGDPTQIHQVILNLCVNARDAMLNGGKLTVSLENIELDDTYAAMNPGSHPGSYVMIKVEDSGVGIAPDVRERIFEPFFTTKEIGKGTGLGLSTTLAIVKSHGGFINLYSELGKGSKFKVYLPADASHEMSEEQSIKQTRLPRGNGELILVVDDEESIRNIARSALERFGYSVLLAEHGAEAVAIYSQHQKEISVVLTDMAMPIMDGPTMIIALKTINPKVRIIGSSGLASNGENSQIPGLKLEYFIPKPYTAEAMLKALRNILDKQ
jgi:signal transduction histidine kinase/CheY-like chemotaxis protein